EVSLMKFGALEVTETDVKKNGVSVATTATAGINQLTGDVTAGPGNGAQPATIVHEPTAATPALTGDGTKSAGSGVTALAAGSASVLNSGTLPAGRLPALTGHVTISAALGGHHV